VSIGRGMGGVTEVLPCDTDYEFRASELRKLLKVGILRMAQLPGPSVKSAQAGSQGA
jgi:hypothetical protein